MTEAETRVDALVAALLPKGSIPAHLRPSQLLEESVVPPARIAARVLALRELVRTGGRAENLLGRRIGSSRDVAEYFEPRLRAEVNESLHVAGLDAKNQVRLVQCVARGGVSTCAVSPADVLRPLLLNACSGAIVVHNHPSGDPTPSRDDIELTTRLVRGGTLLGVRVVDHVIIGADGYFSFLDGGLLATPD
jgi:DNA repair protein RadC